MTSDRTAKKKKTQKRKQKRFQFFSAAGNESQSIFTYRLSHEHQIGSTLEFVGTVLTFECHKAITAALAGQLIVNDFALAHHAESGKVFGQTYFISLHETESTYKSTYNPINSKNNSHVPECEKRQTDARCRCTLALRVVAFFPVRTGID
jgi:hypothetical protein